MLLSLSNIFGTFNFHLIVVQKLGVIICFDW